jgi:alpha-glucosidase
VTTALDLRQQARDEAPAWWRNACIYQVYIRSFADGNGDGIGDLAGMRGRLPYLRDLGVDAIWITPWFPSPMADGGYDVADYRDVDPVFGTLGDAEALIADAHALGLRVILDIVPNHCSDRHPWFQAALAARPGSSERRRFWFRPGRGEAGELPPNDWRSNFGGSAWTRVADGEWYLHLFAAEQPEFDWGNDEVREEFLDVLRFWFDRGIDGMRIDVAHGLVKERELPDVGPDPDPTDLPYVDRPEVHEIWRAWREVADEYADERVLVGEIWVADPTRLALYLRPDELHSAFNFDFLTCGWEPAELRAVIDGTLATHRSVGAPATWVLSNHDVTRHVTRYGRERTSFAFDRREFFVPTDLELGMRRARAAALLTMALPGGVYVYQGEELGLPEVEEIPDERRQDPVWIRSGYVNRGRDGCRVPMPWSGTVPPFGFSAGGAWLPQPAAWSACTVDAQTGDAASMLELYRAALRIRREEPALCEDAFAWLELGHDVLAFARGAGFLCAVNFSETTVELPAHAGLLLASGALVEGLPPDTAVWLRA